MTNEVLAETGPLAPGEDLVLVHHDGTRTEVRGTFAILDISEAELVGAFSRSGANAWVPTPANRESVAYVLVNPGTPAQEIWRSHDQRPDRVRTPFGDGLRRDTTRYQLVEAAPDTVLPPITGDASAANWTFDVPPATGATA